MYPMYQLISDANESEEFEPYKGEELVAELPETMYGGYIDFINGTLIKTMECKTFDGVNL